MWLAVSTKGRRKIICNGKEYVWYVKEDNDYCGKLTLTIISQHKSVHLLYPLEENDLNIINNYGKTFQDYSLKEISKCYISLIEKANPVTPKFVSDIINWAVDGKLADKK